MKKFRKYLYLLQLEEYQTKRFVKWLKENDINLLEEKKGKLKFTTRTALTFLISFPVSFVLGTDRSIILTNSFLCPIFNTLETVIVILAKIKLLLFPNLVKIVITGSYGKTTFKEMLVSVLERKYSILKTEGNINTRIGIAQTIIKNLKNNHQIFVVEAGACQKGEIKRICQLVKPSIGIITIIGWMHLERFGTIDNLRQTKFELKNFIKNQENFFANETDHKFIDFTEVITRIGRKLCIDDDVIKNCLENFKTPEHRLSVNQINKNLTIIDDAYNSNPLGFIKALEALKGYENYQKVLVSPGMIELGKEQFRLNRDLAQKAAEVADVFLVVGQTNLAALKAGVRRAKKKPLMVYMNKDENYREKMQTVFRPPAVILLENDLPDHYF